MHSEAAVAFLSALAGITATLLAVLAAAVAAYSVFLHERRAQYDERIAQAKLQIRAVLLQIRDEWRWTYDHLPPEFGFAYRAKFPDAFGHVFVNRAAGNLIFGGSELESALADLGDRHTRRDHMKGRVFYWLLGEVVTCLTGGRRPGLTSTLGVFPATLEAGFDQWRGVFQQMGENISILAGLRETMIEDYMLYADSHDSVAFRNRLKQAVADDVERFFQRIEAVGRTLDEIAKEETLKRPYDFSQRVHKGSLTTFSILAFIAGTVLPLFLLALELALTPVVLTALLGATLLFTIAAFGQFVFDIWRVPPSVPYHIARWATDIRALVKRTRLG
jgi:hypothetical protein